MRRLRQKKDAKLSHERDSLIDTDFNSSQTKLISDGAVSSAATDVDSNDAAAPSQQIFEPLTNTSKQLRSRSSCYGTWPQKSSASTKVAKESILAEKTFNKRAIKGTNYLETTRPVWSERPPSMNFGKSRETLGITMASTIDNNSTEFSDSKPITTDKVGADSLEHVLADNSTALEVPEQASQKLDSSPVTPPISQGWLQIFLRGPGSQPSLKNDSESIINSSLTISNETIPPQSSEALETLELPNSLKKPNSTGEIMMQPSASSSWLGWFPVIPSAATALPEQEPSTLVENRNDLITNSSSKLTPTPSKFRGSMSGYLWNFWLKGSKSTSEAPDIYGDTSATPDNKNSSYKSSISAQDKKIKDSVDNQSSSEDESKKLKTSSAPKQILITNQLNQEASLQIENLDKKFTSNLLLPSLRSTFQVCEAPSTIEKITRLFNFSQLDTKNIYLSNEIPKVHKAVVIGIHGLVPAPLIRSVIGQPTGTSIRFATHAAEAIRRWTKIHSIGNCKIEIVALEGGGKIAERVENLWKLLLNWINHIQHADFTLVACHSQGVPVAIMLVAKLIEFGVVSTGRIGVCAMAGVSLGPFIEYKSRLIGGSAGELFEFADPESDVSKKYENSLRISLNYGVRVTFCGSIDDQLVSMESSTFSTVTHPYIYRAVFVDGRIHAPDFLSHLVGFALKLRNKGISDHGLIREISAALAGSLYTGEGHSRLYDDEQVYDLAVQFALETTSIKDVPLKVVNNKFSTSNPYALPWIMRGLLEEEYVKIKLTHEATELLKMFVDWKPATKILKDVKYRLEVVKSKL